MRLLYPWNFPGKNIGVGCHFLLQRIFPTQGWNLGLPHCIASRCFYRLSQQASSGDLGSIPESERSPREGYLTLIELTGGLASVYEFMGKLNETVWKDAFLLITALDIPKKKLEKAWHKHSAKLQSCLSVQKWPTRVTLQYFIES